MKADLLILGGEVHTGDAAPPTVSDVAIAGHRIIFVGDAARASISAARRLDARGLVVAPGFIDPHTHALEDLESADPARRLNLNYLTQGVATVLIGNDGEGEPEVSARLQKLQASGIGTNVATYVGFGPVRRRVVGESARAPTPGELQRMRALVAKGMCEGALGLSTGLYYAPQSFSTAEEVIALAREAGLRGGVYDSHLRDEGSDNIGLLAAVREALRIGREGGLPVHIAHIKTLGQDVKGFSAQVIPLIEAERAAGRRVTADQYPWRASGTRVSNALAPRWAMDGGFEALRARAGEPAQAARLRTDMADNLRRRGGPDSILVTSGPHAGRTLAQVAGGWGVDPVAAAVRIILEGDARVASFNMTEADIRAFMVRPWVLTSSDGSHGHPRKSGSFPKKYADYVRDAKLLTTAEFVHRSSGLTADTFGLEGRGHLRPGAFADVVVFDPRTFGPRADYANPERLSEGVRHLFVNGVQVIADARPVQRLGGVALRKTPSPAADCTP
ncbi:MAG: amidohydrolase family protein [Proteobacteria bacterium]|nr:amidohydrolase family protein [Pseudomonadota bacterium]